MAGLRRAVLAVTMLSATVLAGCIENDRLGLPPLQDPSDWARLGDDPATAYDCLLHSARAFAADPRAAANTSSDAWDLPVGQEDRLRLQVAALRSDRFDSIGFDLGPRGFRMLMGDLQVPGALDEKARLPDGRIVWYDSVEVTIQSSSKGTWTIAGALVPRGGGGAVSCAAAHVTVE